MLLENVIDTVENCRYCLMCRHVAPVGLVTYEEALTPHGIALMVASQRRGMIDWNPETVAVIYAEPDGGNCRAHCVTDQPLPEAIAAVRAEIVEMGAAPEVVYAVHEKLKRWNTPFAEESYTPSRQAGDTALLLSDEAMYLWEGVEDEVLKLLDMIGIQPVVIGRGCSTGYLASSLGFPQTASEQATMILDELQVTGASRLLTISPGDYFTLNQLYDERLGLTLPDDVELIDLTVLLASHLAEGSLKFKQDNTASTYVYVDPTHAVRVPQRHDAPRQLLKAVSSDTPRELFWRRERAHPVGSTALQFTRPDIAEKLTRARLEDAKSIGAEVLVCEDPATLHHLAQYAEFYDLQVVGLYGYLADHLN